MYIFAAPILRLVGQPPELAAQAGKLSIWFIPVHYAFVFILPLQRFLQCQLKNIVHAVVSAIVLIVHLFMTWLFVYRYRFGLFGTAMVLNFSWWVGVGLLMAFVLYGGCRETWKGFSMLAFDGLWEFLKLSAASGVMLWYGKDQLVNLFHGHQHVHECLEHEERQDEEEEDGRFLIEPKSSKTE
ncbi:hypothetical protein KFK09_019447 [Dendrobium nobile]|uniref:Uncharacterized protein n=1 Tax=Dendrobium nobile TaxID=94219 RepID=A0A8T3AQA0_DENNO|nr:hypothetical protein KFK09_019447 [Dendrobium nobile]